MLRDVCKFLVRAAAITLAVLASLQAAHAVSIELRDEAPDRIERQRAAAIGKLPLPGTPDTSQFASRLAADGLKTGLPILIRIFKAESELEVWMEKGSEYVLFAKYPICHWSGTLGPKIREGDKQTPEGFYTITTRQLHRLGRWTRALNLGFPNAYDESLKRDGSYILVHGGCSSVGCFAMTNPVIEEIYTLTSAALRGGQRHVPVHVFPFRMTQDNLNRHKDAEWHTFWMNLKEGYDAFERTKRPPYVGVCDGRYRIEAMNAAAPPEEGAPGPLAVCGPTAAGLLGSDKSAWLVRLDPKMSVLTVPVPAMLPALPRQAQSASTLPIPQPSSVPGPLAAAPSQPPFLPPLFQRQVPPPFLLANSDQLLASKTTAGLASEYELVPRLVAPPPAKGRALSGIRDKALPCSLALASCRKYAALLVDRSKVRSKVASQSRIKAASRLR